MYSIVYSMPIRNANFLPFRASEIVETQFYRCSSRKAAP